MRMNNIEKEFRMKSNRRKFLTKLTKKEERVYIGLQELIFSKSENCINANASWITVSIKELSVFLGMKTKNIEKILNVLDNLIYIELNRETFSDNYIFDNKVTLRFEY